MPAARLHGELLNGANAIDRGLLFRSALISRLWLLTDRMIEWRDAQSFAKLANAYRRPSFMQRIRFIVTATSRLGHWPPSF